MKINDIANDKFKKEFEKEYLKIKTRKKAGWLTRPHEDKKKKLKKGYEKNKGNYIDTWS